jgi:hypothetical protein
VPLHCVVALLRAVNPHTFKGEPSILDEAFEADLHIIDFDYVPEDQLQDYIAPMI